MILGTVPMLAYPFVLMANLMSFVAVPDPSAGSFERFASGSFMVLSTAYPIPWIGGLVGAVVMLAKRRPKPAAWAAAVPLAYLLLVAGAWWLWSLA